MASFSDREAAAFFAHLFRTPMFAGDASEGSQGFNPIIVGVLSSALPTEDGAPIYLPDRILFVHPISRRFSVLTGDPATFFEMLSANSRRKSPPPASKASIEAMQTVEEVDEGEECVICLEELGQSMVKEMPCKHRFHGDCIDKWLGLHGTCPVCRFCMPAEEATPKKVGNDGSDEGEEVERAVWFEIAFGRGVSGDRVQDQEQQIGGQSGSAAENSS